MREIIGEVFDPKADFSQWDRSRPHRVQPAAITFLTIRLNDSIPADVIRVWHQQRIEFLHRHGIDCDRDWKSGRERLPPIARAKFDKQFRRLREICLDDCMGECCLRNPGIANEFARSLEHFHEDRYWMGDYVIVPNHVHCLVAFADERTAKTQPGYWMRYTACQINRQLSRDGALWFPEPFDHLVRSEEQLNYLRDYIRDNPKKARLAEGEFLYRRSGGHF